MDGAHTARFAHFTFEVSRICACLVHETRSGDENASRNTCSSYAAEKVGYIQYVLLNILASGSAYHPLKTGLCVIDLLACEKEFAETANDIMQRIKSWFIGRQLIIDDTYSTAI